jgi:GH15 family glucan-1,4-alpha-glucosidase
VARFRLEREAIHNEIESRGFNGRIGSYTRTFGGDELDASLLTLPLHGYIDAGHPRMRAIWSRICEQLGRGPLVFRYPNTYCRSRAASRVRE